MALMASGVLHTRKVAGLDVGICPTSSSSHLLFRSGSQISVRPVVRHLDRSQHLVGCSGPEVGLDIF